MTFERRVLVPHEIQQPLCLVGTDKSRFGTIPDNHPLARGERADQLAVPVIEIKMLIAGAPRGPDKRLAFVNEVQVMIELDPMCTTFLEQRSRRTVVHIDLQQLKEFLITRLALYGKCI